MTVTAGPVLSEIPRPQARPATAAALAAPAGQPSVDLPLDVPAAAARQPAAIPASLAPPDRGPETNLPLPRFVSLRTGEANVRRGPSLSHRIDWVFVRRGMPLQITGEYGHWRRVVDREGIGGWIHYALLTGYRTVIVDRQNLEIRRRPDTAAPVVARLEAGVIAELDECAADWCRISAGGYRGWAPKPHLWGIGSSDGQD